MLRMRPHHAMCLQHFIGVGYDPAFVDNMERIFRELEDHEETLVRLVASADDICAACIYNINGVCRTEKKVKRFDRAALRFMGAETGDTLQYGEIKKRIHKNIIETNLTGELCADCEWLDVCLSEEKRNAEHKRQLFEDKG